MQILVCFYKMSNQEPITRESLDPATHRKGVRIVIPVFAFVVRAKEVPTARAVYRYLARERLNGDAVSMNDSIVMNDICIPSVTNFAACPAKLENALADTQGGRNALLCHCIPRIIAVIQSLDDGSDAENRAAEFQVRERRSECRVRDKSEGARMRDRERQKRESRGKQETRRNEQPGRVVTEAG